MPDEPNIPDNPGASPLGGTPLFAANEKITKINVADEIKNVIGQYRAANLLAAGETSLHYIVLVGGDDVVPFFRYPDDGGLANENEYYPPLEDKSAANAPA